MICADHDREPLAELPEMLPVAVKEQLRRFVSKRVANADMRAQIVKKAHVCKSFIR
jgi:hypothetical protein